MVSGTIFRSTHFPWSAGDVADSGSRRGISHFVVFVLVRFDMLHGQSFTLESSQVVNSMAQNGGACFATFVTSESEDRSYVPRSSQCSL